LLKQELEDDNLFVLLNWRRGREETAGLNWMTIAVEKGGQIGNFSLD